MSIEIRPNAVTAQTNDKFKELSSMLGTIESVRAALNGFADSGAVLSGAGYDAARSHMAQYDRLLNTLEASVRAVRDADTKVRAELGVFGCDRVSEREWKDGKTRALRRARMLRAQADALAQSAPPTAAGLECEMMALARSEQAARHNADHAGHMLSLIYSYCEKTNGLYEGAVEQIGKMAAAGVSSFANCRFSVANGVGVWEPIDESLWFDQGVYDSCAYAMKKKGFGEVCDLVFASPTVTAIERWWDENAVLISNLKKITFAVIDFAIGSAMIASGVGIPLGIALWVYSAADFTSGSVGLIDGEDYDWEAAFSREAALLTGANPDAVEGGVKTVGAGIHFVGAAGIFATAGRLIDSVGSLRKLSETVEVEEIFSGAIEAASAVKSSGASVALTEKRAALVEKIRADALNIVEGLGDAFDFSKDVEYFAAKKED